MEKVRAAATVSHAWAVDFATRAYVAAGVGDTDARKAAGALDSEGEPTTDPAARQNGGSYAPLTQYKGSGLAIVLAAINNFLSGNPFDDQRQRPEGGQIFGSCSHWFAAYDVAQFVDPQQFTAEVRALRDRIHATTPRAGFERVYAPGEIENDNARNYSANGIPLEQFTLDELHWVAEHTGIAWD